MGGGGSFIETALFTETIVYQSPVGGGQVGHEGRAAGAVAGCPTNPKCLAVPTSEIVRLVPPSGLVLKHGVFDARGSTGVVAAACTVCQREIGQISGGVRRDRGTTGSVSTVKDGWRFQPPWWAAQRGRA